METIKLLKDIHTDRHFEKRSFFDIVYEWEDELSKALSLPLVPHHHKLYNRPAVIKVLNKAGIYKLFQALDNVLPAKQKSLYYDMGPRFTYSNTTSKNIIPILIDFWKSYQVDRFNKVYKNCELVFISSLEVYNYLKEHNCTVNIQFLPLSLPDKYRIDVGRPYKKEIDIISVGRNNPVLLQYVERLASKHPHITYACQIIEHGANYFKTNVHHLDLPIDTRQQYMEFLKKGRVAFYTTPGIDGGEKRTGGFNPVTPRLFELLYAGCHLVGRYPDTEETQFFNLPQVCPVAGTYNEFESLVMHYLSNDEQPLAQNSAYLQLHYTSRRAEQLKAMLSN